MLCTGTVISNSKVSESTAVAVVNIPVYFLAPTPSEINPKLPKEEFEFVTSHWPPLPQKIPTSLLIVNIETICAYPSLVIDTPIPLELY